MKKSIAGIYAITPEYQPTSQWLDSIKTVLTAGIQVLQFRSKQLNPTEKLKVAQTLKALCQSTDTVFIINDDIELTQQVNADGVHLGQGDGQIKDARLVLGNQAIIGRTCHADLDLAMKAQQDGADYVAFGQVFTSNSKNSPHRASLDFLSTAKNQLDTPIIAIGGITVDNAASVFETKIASIAMIQGLWGNSSKTQLTDAVFTLNQIWRQSR